MSDFLNTTQDIGSVLTISNSATSPVNGNDIVNANFTGVNLLVAATIGGTSTLVLEVQIKDAVSGHYKTILTSASLAATGDTLLSIHPGITAAANAAVAMILSRVWRVKATITGDPITVTVGANYVL